MVDAADGFGIDTKEAVSVEDLIAQHPEEPPTLAIVEASALEASPNATEFVSRIERLFLVLRQPDDPARREYIGKSTTTYLCEPFDYEDIRKMLNAMRDIID